MDEFIDMLLNEERVCDVILPRLQKRSNLEDTNALEPRQSLLDEDLQDIDLNEDLDPPAQEDEKDTKERGKRRDNNDRGGSDEDDSRRHRRHRDRHHRDDSPYRERRRDDRDYDKRRDRDDRDRRGKKRWAFCFLNLRN